MRLRMCLCTFAASAPGRRKGLCDEWLSGASTAMRKVSETVNGPAFTELAQRIGQHNVQCIEFFRKGWRAFMCLLCLSVHAPAAGAPLIDEGAEWHLGLCQASNAELFAQLRSDVNEEQLHQIAHDDAAKHRMSVPKKADADIMGKVLCCPRFGVEQGVRPDGTKKLRAVDHFSWSQSGGQKKRKRREIKWNSINGHFTSDAEVKHDHLDDLLAAMKLQFETTGQVCVVRLCVYVCAALYSLRVPGSRIVEGRY